MGGRYAFVFLDAVSDFFIVAGSTIAGVMVEHGGGEMPSLGVWVLAVVMGAVAAWKQVKARLAESPR